MRSLMIFLFVLMAAALLVVQDSSAAIYKYIDKDGLVTFADDLQSIPEQYRQAAKSVGSDGDGQASGATATAAPQQQEAAASQPPSVVERPAAASPFSRAWGYLRARDTLGSRALASLVVTVTVLFGLAVIRTLDKDRKRPFAVARLSLLWVLTVYLLVAHAGDAVRIVTSLVGKVDAAKQESEERGKKAAKAVKALNAFVEEVNKATEAPPAEPAGRE